MPISERYCGPPILKEGLRPFFLLANTWAVVSMLLWIGILSGFLGGPGSLSAVDWHRHELMFAYTSAIIAGFLLTVVSNWTSRTPISGIRLFALVMIWIAGRLAMYAPASFPDIWLITIDLAFPIALTFVIAYELIAGKNYLNLKIVGVLAVFSCANLSFHIQVFKGLSPDTSVRLGLTAVLLLIMIIGGRVIPAFTRNWLLRIHQEQAASRTISNPAERLPAPFGLYDMVTVTVSALMLLTWTFIGESRILGWGMLFAALLHIGRLARWCGEKTFSDPLVLILHLAYIFIPLGFFAFAASQLWTLAITTSAASHLWTAGAVSVVSMAVMTRASLGHTGRALVADPMILLIYVSLMSSVLVRFAAGSSPNYLGLIQYSAALWCFAHAMFLVKFSPIFFTAR